MTTHITEFSPCRCYRYTLWRECYTQPERFDFFEGTNDGERGNRLGEYLMVIGLNPSTADETKDDPTIRRCIGFAKRWGFSALCMTNLFAWRDTKPANMMVAQEPVGFDNGKWLCEIAEGAGMILAAWGKDGKFKSRDRQVLSAIRAIGKPVHCLKQNKDGSPMHPLYVAAETIPLIYAP